jgi:hypothetical protein
MDVYSRLTDKLGARPLRVNETHVEYDDVIYTLSDKPLGRHKVTGHKFAFSLEDGIDTYMWVPSLMSYEMYNPALGEVVRLIDKDWSFGVLSVSEGAIGLSSVYQYTEDYVAFVGMDEDGIDIVDSANGDRWLCGTPEGVMERLAWFAEKNNEMYEMEQKQGGVSA